MIEAPHTSRGLGQDRVVASAVWHLATSSQVDMESGRLQEYCLLAKGSKGRMLVDIIQRATSDPTLFAFGELLVVPTIEQVNRRQVELHLQHR